MSIKIGLGLYRSQLNADNYQFAKQAGATHIVAHLTDYFKGVDPKISSGNHDGWGDCSQDELWDYTLLKSLVDDVAQAGLKLEAIENFSPKFWSDILLDGPKRSEQIDGIKQLISDVGKAGIPCFGYNFSIAGVYGWTRGPYARGGAMSVGFGVESDKSKIPDPNASIPDGMVWNMRYREAQSASDVINVSDEQLWDRLKRFLAEIVPIAEKAGVILAAHPDDPPMQKLRNTSRLVNHPDKYNKLMSLAPSKSNGMELCLGTLQEMDGGSIYPYLRDFVRTGKIGYIHFRNVKGKVPHYHETFVDDGDIDMAEVVRILRDEQYDGVIIPDHTPAMNCASSWHAGMAFALGYMRALVQNAEYLGASRTM